MDPMTRWAILEAIRRVKAMDLESIRELKVRVNEELDKIIAAKLNKDRHQY